ncbi:MAG: aldehyde dehydrogenase family protein [Bacteroidota bacterium]
MPAVASKQDLASILKTQRANTRNMAATTATQRRERIKRIEDYLTDEANRNRLVEALQKDFGKPEVETLTSEVGIVLTHARYARKRLARWMKPKRVRTPLSLFGTTSHIRYEPKGQALIISPWNYPVNLSLYPLIGAIAAGCTVVLKPSEVTQHTSAYMRDMLSDLFPPEEVSVVLGEAEVSQELTAMPFNHIFFTGSPAVGKKVMAAAAKNLASVTLELGGKSPCIVDETANLGQVVDRIVWAKHFNCGQTCIAPDYLLVHESQKEKLIGQYLKAIESFYGADPRKSKDYARVVSEKHHQRLSDLLEDALDKGATILAGGQRDPESRYFAPTLVVDLLDNAELMHEEVFGPIMPLLTYRDLDEAIRFINDRPKPLTLYMMSRSRTHIKRVLNQTSAGGTLINELLLGYANPELPFGGVNNSGIGKSFGHHGFLEFSNERSVLRRRFLDLKMIYPPYPEKKLKLVRWLHKKL